MLRTEISILTLVLTLLVGMSTASAEPALSSTHSTHEPHHVVGAKGAILFLVDGEGETATGGGAAFFVERSLIHHVLELELSVGALTVHDEVLMPIELVLEVPLAHVAGGLWVPYAALGGLVDVVFLDGDVHAYPGLVAAVGSYVWFSESWGIDVDFTYGIVFENGHVLHEMIPATGPVVRF